MFPHLLKMFEELRTKLNSIDAVLNEEGMNSINALDRNRGFDPTKEYTPEELKKLYPSGLEALKKSGGESRYLLLEVRLEDEGSQYTKLYLRGFDVPINAHPALADRFLIRELQPVVTPPFELPTRWPYTTRGMNYDYDSAITRESGELKLTVSAIGGGMFDLKNSRINLRGSSMAFGHIPQPYQDKLSELLGQLVQRPAYNGFQVNFG